MDAALLAAIAAASRAIAYVARPDAGDRDLEPPHPAFVGFRRMTYVWTEGSTLEPIGDRIRLWLDFLRGQGTAGAWLSLDAGTAVVATSGGVAAVWHVVDADGSLTMRGARAEVGPALRVDAAAADRLARALALAKPEAGLRRDEIERATAILESQDDGAEVSDVAWPYFLLPGDGYSAADRRLLAAAVSAWPASDDVTSVALRHAAAAAMTAAVNSPALREPVK